MTETPKEKAEKKWKEGFQEYLEIECNEIIKSKLQEHAEEDLRVFNWMWKAHLKNQYTQQQFSAMFRKSIKKQIGD